MSHSISESELEILRALSPETKLRVAAELYWGARKLELAGIRDLNPELFLAGCKGRIAYTPLINLIAICGWRLAWPSTEMLALWRIWSLASFAASSAVSASVMRLLAAM